MINIIFFLMNPSCYFQPYWPFINPSNVYPLLQMASFQSYYYSAPKVSLVNSVVPNMILQKKSVQTSKQSTSQEKKILDKRRPIKKEKEDKNFSYRYQDKDRNIYSNILKGLLCKIRQDYKFQIKCQQSIEQFNFDFKLDDLLNFLDQNFQKNKTYISPTFMRNVLEQRSDNQVLQFFKYLLSRYLKQGFLLVLLGSQRIQKQSKVLQMKKARELWDLLYGKGDNSDAHCKQESD